MDISYMVTINYAPFIGILFMLVFLMFNNHADAFVKNAFVKLLAFEFIDLMVYNWELITSEYAKPSMLRVLLSVIGYIIRPVLVYLIVMVSNRENMNLKAAVLYAVPLFVNAAFVCTAFFSGIVFSFTADNHFSRGPLGYLPQVIMGFYLVVTGLNVIRNARRKNKLETVVVLLSVILVTASMVIESVFNIRSLDRTTIIMITIFYYMYFQSLTYRNRLEKEMNISRRYMEYSAKDRLTGLLNKTSFTEQLERRLEDNSKPSGLIFFDMDNFKNFNDRLGHLTGDELLKTVARKLGETFRSTDLLGRFGGDEFYVYLDDINQDILEEKAKRLLSSMQITWKDTDVSVTASLGVCFIPKDTVTNSERVLLLADKALYEAKHAGRNCYRVYTAG